MNQVAFKRQNTVSWWRLVLVAVVRVHVDKEEAFMFFNAKNIQIYWSCVMWARGRGDLGLTVLRPETCWAHFTCSDTSDQRRRTETETEREQEKRLLFPSHLQSPRLPWIPVSPLPFSAPRFSTQPVYLQQPVPCIRVSPTRLPPFFSFAPTLREEVKRQRRGGMERRSDGKDERGKEEKNSTEK